MGVRRARGAAQSAAAVLMQLAARLRAADYTPDQLRAALAITVPDDIGLLNHAPAVERLAAQRSPAAILTRLFFLEVDETARNVTAVFSAEELAALGRLGVLRRRGARFCSRIRVDPIGSQYFIADRRFRVPDRGALHLPGHDPVYAPSGDSLMLRDAVIASESRCVLDLCTGSGIQALQCASHADRVIAVDVNPRAVAMATFNAQLNGVHNVNVHVGDLYAPVRRTQFDLVLANPPFVASPYRRGPSYHSGGATGDRVLQRVIAGWGGHLRQGGRAFAISHVALRSGEALPARAQRWFANFPGRALVLLVETGTPVDLAAAQALFALRRGLLAYAAEIKRWLAYLRRHRIQTVALILIAAERGDRRRVEVVEAQSRVLPIPLTPTPAARVAAWLTA